MKYFIYLLFAVITLSHEANAEGKIMKKGTQKETETWQEQAVRYARIMSRIKWTPVEEGMPNNRGKKFKKGKKYTGVPYSSVKSVGRYIGFDIFLKTFLAAVQNPNSVLYSENLSKKVTNSACYYGKVCSSYTSYALQCGIWFVSRRHGPPYGKGISLVEPQDASTVKVGDIIFTPPAGGSHVELVTEIIKDSDGNVTHIRVEDSWPKTTRNQKRDVANFNKHLSTKNKKLYRITNFEEWRGDNKAESFLFPNYEEDAKTPVINQTLLLDRGDWVPYKRGQIVRFNIMDKGGKGVKKLVSARTKKASFEKIRQPKY